MDAYELAYDVGETLMALGAPTGLVEIRAVDPEDGSPAELVSKVLHHKKPISFLAFADADHVLSVDESGRIALSEARTGKIVREASVKGEYVSAGLSPSGRMLFLFTYLDSTATAFRWEVGTGTLQQGPSLKKSSLGIQSRVFGYSDTTAAYHFLDDDWKKEAPRVEQGLCMVDFEAQTFEERRFAGKLASTFHADDIVFDIKPARNIGIRFDYAHPVEILEKGQDKWLLLKLEAFAADTLQPLRAPVVVGFNLEEMIEDDRSGEIKHLLAPDGSKKYHEAKDQFFRELCSGKITEDGRYAWVGVRGGAVRRIALDGSDRSPMVLHGGTAPQGGLTLDDVFARNLTNNWTLALSPSGRYVAFANPNEFFNAETLDLKGSKPIRLPKRGEKAGSNQVQGVAESPSVAKFTRDGRFLVVVVETETTFLVDPATGKVKHTLDIEYADVVDVAVSMDGTQLALGCSGSNAYLADLKGAKAKIGAQHLIETPMPPHSILATFLPGGQAVFAHHSGGVAVLEPGSMLAFRKDDEEQANTEKVEYSALAESEDEDFMEALYGNGYFEQKYDIYGAVAYDHDGATHIALVNEDDTVEAYAVEPDCIRFAFSHDLDGRTYGMVGVTAGHGKLAFGTEKGEVFVYEIQAKKLKLRASFEEPGLRWLKMSQATDALYGFNEASGEFFQFDIERGQRKVRFRYEGAAIQAMDWDEPSGRVMLTEGEGRIVLFDLDTLKVQSAMQILASSKGRQLKVEKACDIRLHRPVDQ